MQSKKTIMIIDDNELIVDTMSIYFDDDYNIIKFGGKDCAHKVKKYFSKKVFDKPDIALIDLALGNGCTGIDLADLVKQHGVQYILFFTGCHPIDPIVAKAKSLKYEVLEKPLRLSRLAKRLSELVSA